jgi:F0F1-type ATP synthase assembly protein I
MVWLSWLGKGLLSGAIIVAASEVAKKSTLYGAIIISIPFVSIMSMIWLYSDTKDTAKVAEYADGIVWLVLPSLLLFIIMPYLLRRDWSFEAAMGIGLLATTIAYLIGAYVANNYGGLNA